MSSAVGSEQASAGTYWQTFQVKFVLHQGHDDCGHLVPVPPSCHVTYPDFNQPVCSSNTCNTSDNVLVDVV